MYPLTYLLFSVLAAGDGPSLTSVVLDAVLKTSNDVAQNMSELGIGIASLLLLISVFQSVTAILDGGQFQSKMLLPLVLYTVICNFSFISVPTEHFVRTINSEAENAVRKYKIDKLKGKTNLQYYFEETVNHSPIAKGRLIELRDKSKEDMEELPGAHTSGADSPDLPNLDPGKYNPVDFNAQYEYNNGKAKQGDTNGGKHDGWISRLVNKLKDKFKEICEDGARAWQLWGEGNGAGGLYDYVAAIVEFGFSWFVALIMQWLVSIVSFFQTVMGGLMIGVLMAFGPITWAFALFPGNGKTIFTWFVRLAQFSLYGPLVCLIEAFNMSILTMSVSGNATVNGEMVTTGFFGDVFSAFVIIALLVVNLVSLFSVPALATMIIEGAVGSISLFANISSGLNVRTMLEQLGEGRRDNQQTTLLQQIANNTSGNGSGGVLGGGGGGGIFGRPHS